MPSLKERGQFGITIIDRYSDLVTLAEKLGYEIQTGLCSSLTGYAFTKGQVHIWGVIGGWQVADLYPIEHDSVSNYFQNHRPCQYLVNALLREAYKSGEK